MVAPHFVILLLSLLEFGRADDIPNCTEGTKPELKDGQNFCFLALHSLIGRLAVLSNFQPIAYPFSMRVISHTIKSKKATACRFYSICRSAFGFVS